MAMNAIALWRTRKGYSLEEAAQVLDAGSAANYELIERGAAPAKLPGVHAIERELGATYSSLKKELP